MNNAMTPSDPSITQEIRNQVVQKLSTMFPNHNVAHSAEVVERMCFNKSEGNKDSYIRLCSKLLMSCNRPKQSQTQISSSSASLVSSFSQSSSDISGNKVIELDNMSQKKMSNPIRISSFNNQDSNAGTSMSNSNNLMPVVTLPGDPMNALQNITANAGKNGGNNVNIGNNIVSQGSTGQQPHIIVHSMNIPQAQQANISMRIAQPIYNNQIRQINPNIQQRQPITAYRQQQPPSTVNTATNQIQHITTASALNSHQSNNIRILHPKIHISQGSQPMQSSVQYDSSNIPQGHHQIYRPNNAQMPISSSQMISSNNTVIPMVTTAGSSISMGNSLQQHLHHGHNINIHPIQTQPMYQQHSQQNHPQHHSNSNKNPNLVTSGLQNIKNQSSSNSNINATVPQQQHQAQVQAQSGSGSSSKSSQQVPPSAEEAQEVAEELTKLLQQYGPVLKFATQTSASVFPDEAKKKVAIAIKSLLENHTTITKPIYRRNLPKIREICKSTESYWRQYKLRKDNKEVVSQKKVEALSITSKSTNVIGIPQHQTVNIPDPLIDSNPSSAPLSLDIAYDDVMLQLAQLDPRLVKNAQKRIMNYILKDATGIKYKKLASKFNLVKEEPKKEEPPFREDEFDLADSEFDKTSSNKVFIGFGHLKLKNMEDCNEIFDESGLLKTNLKASDFIFRLTNDIYGDLEAVSKEFQITLPSLEDRQKSSWKIAVEYKNTSLQLTPLILELSQQPGGDYFVSNWSWQHQYDPRSITSSITKQIEQEIQKIKLEMLLGPPLLFTLSLYKQAILEVSSGPNSSEYVPVNPGLINSDQSMMA